VNRSALLFPAALFALAAAVVVFGTGVRSVDLVGLLAAGFLAGALVTTGASVARTPRR
jgi:hypothetical protein